MWSESTYLLFIFKINPESDLLLPLAKIRDKAAIISHQNFCNKILSGFPNSVLAFLTNQRLYKTALVIL